MLHAHSTIENKSDLTNTTINQLEVFFGQVRFFTLFKLDYYDIIFVY
jgi:hypothetical protein